MITIWLWSGYLTFWLWSGYLELFLSWIQTPPIWGTSPFIASCYRKLGTPDILFPFPLAVRAWTYGLSFPKPVWHSKTPASDAKLRDI